MSTHVPERKSKEVSLAQAGEIVARAKTLALAGSQVINTPMALIRAAIAAGANELTVIPAIDASIGVDLMVAAGVVDTLVVSYVGFETFGLAPAFRSAAEQRTIKIVEADEPFIIHGTRAAAAGLPFIPLKGVYEATDLPKLNPLLKTTTDPYTGETVTTIPALRTDVCIIHAQACDPYGNAQIWGGNQQELDKAKASDTVVVSAERIVPVERSRYEPHKVTVPGHLVEAVVHVPFGAHPTQAPGFYLEDPVHIREYVGAVREGHASAYLKRYVQDPKTHAEYLEEIGFERLVSLMREIPA